MNRPGKKQGRMRRLTIAMLIATAPALAGCEAALLVGGMMQNYEYQKLVQVLPQYSDLEDRSVAVIVDADLATLYEYPDLVATVADNVSGRIQNDVPGARVMHPRAVLAWQYSTPQWNAMPYGELAEKLDVDRVVVIDIFEYRLNPPGNRWEWEGICAASVGIIERDGFSPDSFAESFTVVGRYPSLRLLTRDEADQRTIERGLLAEFIKETAWLFHEHERPKYPDKYRAPK
jgi:hypothetical protein